jgi:hypothetical protein
MDRDAINRWREHIRPWITLAVKVYGSVFYPRALEKFGYLDGRERSAENNTSQARGRLGRHHECEWT